MKSGLLMPSYNFTNRNIVSIHMTVESHNRELINKMGSGVSKAVDRTANITRRAMQMLIIGGARTGRIYFRRGGNIHQASAPGEPPKKDDGQLANQIINRMVDPLNAEIDTMDNEYAAALEFGRNDGTIKPRPFFQKTVLKNQSTLETEVQKAIREEGIV